MNIPQALQERLPAEVNSQLQRRSMVVQRLKVFPIESIVRGYITGSAWSSYQKNGTVCDNALPTGLRESERLPQPLWTPSTKAEAGGKDENISPSEGGSLPNTGPSSFTYPMHGKADSSWQRQELWDKHTPIKSNSFRSSSTKKPTLTPLSRVSLLQIPSSSLDLTNPPRQRPWSSSTKFSHPYVHL